MLLDENGDLRSFHEFKKAMLGSSIDRDYNRNWLRTEYNMAVRAARSAAYYRECLETAHLYPNLEYLESSAANKRDDHFEYVGTVLPIDHPWWDTHMPPSAWGCECGVRKTDKPVTPVPQGGQPVNPVFDNNPGKTAEFINTAEHPYVKSVADSIEKEIRNKAEELAEEVIEKVFKSGGILQRPKNFKQNSKEEAKNIKAYTELAKYYGGKYKLLSVVNKYKRKNPDALNLETGKYSDAKIPESKIGKNAIQNSIKRASEQRVSEVYIYLERDYSMQEIWAGLKTSLQDGRAKTVETIIVRFKNGEHKVYDAKKLRGIFNKNG